MRCIQWFGGSGLVDHILVATANGGVDTYGANSFDTIYPGDYNWSHALTPGSADCVYIEDSEFIYTSVLDGAWDSYNGAKICFRYNDVQGTNMGSHGLDSSAGRSAILQEVYNNTWTNSGSAIYSWAASRGGTGFVFNNTVSSSGGSYTVYADLREYREDNAFSWGSTCAGSGLIDQNTAGQSGYACRDQIGRGPETAPASDWPINTSTPTYSEALIPMYFWGNSFKGSTPTIGQVNINNSSNTCSGCPVQTAQILNNRDFYMEAAAFNGTAGTGTGLLSARPGTCTPQVGYWATDTNTLYQCSATNTWTVYYAPYTYPHPLTQGSGGGA